MVSPDAIRTVVGILGNLVAMGMYLSPVPTFIQICKKGSVEQFSPAPYLATLLNCMLWVLYGLPLMNPHCLVLIITMNASGCVIELIYVLLFICYSDGKKRLKVVTIMLVEFALVAILTILVVTLAHTHEHRSFIVGSLCVVVCSLMYIAPLSVIKLVITTKSVEYMPFFLSLASFVSGACWTSYALIRFDLFLLIPNVLGALFGLGQLILYAAFSKSTKRQIAERNSSKCEEGLSMVVVVGDSNKTTNGDNRET